jgi:hypothetical protein
MPSYQFIQGSLSYHNVALWDLLLLEGAVMLLS